MTVPAKLFVWCHNILVVWKSNAYTGPDMKNGSAAYFPHSWMTKLSYKKLFSIHLPMLSYCQWLITVKMKINHIYFWLCYHYTTHALLHLQGMKPLTLCNCLSHLLLNSLKIRSWLGQVSTLSVNRNMRSFISLFIYQQFNEQRAGGNVRRGLWGQHWALVGLFKTFHLTNLIMSLPCLLFSACTWMCACVC